MTLARFSLQNNLEKIGFFKETFLLGDTNIEIVLEIFFLAFSNIDFQFGAKKLTWRFYTTTKALPTTSWVKFINKSELAKAALDENFGTFVVYLTILEISTVMLIYPSRASQL